MSGEIDEGTPDLEELQQVEVSLATVPVRIEEAVTVWELPNRRVRYDTVSTSDTSWTQALDASKKRQTATLISTSQPFRVRVSSSGLGLAWPINVPFPVRHSERVQVLCATPATSTDIGVVEEFWAD
jgi:hypothetical protein